LRAAQEYHETSRGYASAVLVQRARRERDAAVAALRGIFKVTE
jgi:hypothetical protein